METITTNFKQIEEFLATPEADMLFVKTAVDNHDFSADERRDSWVREVARKFNLEVAPLIKYAIANPASFLPQTVVRNLVRVAQTSGLLSLTTQFTGVQSVAWNIVVRDDFQNPEAWATVNNAHIWSVNNEGVAATTAGTSGYQGAAKVNAAAGADEPTTGTLKIEQGQKIINVNIVAGFVYKYTKLPRRLTVLHPQLVGMVLDELAAEVIRTIEAAITWGGAYQSDDRTVNVEFIRPIAKALDRVMQFTPANTSSILPIISEMRQAYGFWNGFEEAPDLVMNGTAWRELYNAILAKVQSLVAINEPIKAILGYTKEEIERELGMKIHVVHDYDLSTDEYMKSGSTAKFIIGDMKAYGVLLPDGLSESFTFFRLQRNEEELLNEVLIGGDVINIAKLFYTEYAIGGSTGGGTENTSSSSTSSAPAPTDSTQPTS